MTLNNWKDYRKTLLKCASNKTEDNYSRILKSIKRAIGLFYYDSEGNKYSHTSNFFTFGYLWPYSTKVDRY